MNNKRNLIIILSTILFTCISCAHDSSFEEEIYIHMDVDSINNESQPRTKDSVPSSNTTLPGLDNTTQSNGSYHIDSLFNINNHSIIVTDIINYMYQTPTVASAQGAAAYGDYLFQFKDRNAGLYIYNLKKKTFVKMITLTSNNNNHCNQASFSDIFYQDNDQFPLLYVSGGKSGTYNHVQVYRIIGTEESIAIQQVQEIILPKTTDQNWVSWTCCILDNENHYLYAYASNNSTRLIKFDIPDCHQETISLNDYDIIDYIPIDHIAHQQGGIIRKGFFYMIFGVPAWGDQVWLRIFNLNGKKEYIRYNLSEKGFPREPESLFFYNNELYAITNNIGIYKICFKKEN